MYSRAQNACKAASRILLGLGPGNPWMNNEAPQAFTTAAFIASVTMYVNEMSVYETLFKIQ